MEKLNRWLVLIANFGVVVGIGFVAYEMRLNTDAMRSSTAAQTVTNWNSITMEMATDAELRAAILEIQERGMDVLNDDPIAFHGAGALASSMYKAGEYMFIEYQNGNVDEELWAGQKSANRSFIGEMDFMKIFWTLARWQVAPSFREYMDAMIRDICSKRDCPAGGRPEDWANLAV